MKSMLLAVFGHYDSRGGTMAMPLPEICQRPKKTRRVNQKAMKAVYDTIRHYEKEVFGLEEPDGEIQTTAYGMPARQADKMVHAMLHGDSVGIEDFMYVAELHYSDSASLEGDLDEGSTRVLIEWKANTREGVVNDMLQKWPKVRHVVEVSKIGDTIRKSLLDPVQLELVTVPKGWQDNYNKRHDEYWEVFGKANPFRQNYSFSSSWTPEQHELVKEAQKRWEEIEAELHAEITNRATLKGMTLTRWDDDAYGFIIGTGL